MFYPTGRPAAVARIQGGSELPDVIGSVKFYDTRTGVLVVADVSGLPQSCPGFYAMHIHEGRVCTGEGFSDTAGHYNPTKAPHPCHAGDLPPLLNAGGRAYLAVLTDRFRIDEIAGRTVVMHSGPDDFMSQPAGNSGTKIACGEIRRV